MTDNNSRTFIEVNGVRFETLVPQTQFKLPLNSEIIPIEFGIKLTNLADIPYRFALQMFFPEFLDASGNFIQIGINRNHVRDVHESDIPLIMPQDTIEFLIKNELAWDQNLGYGGIAGKDNIAYGGFWGIKINSGNYQVRFHYNSVNYEQEIRLWQGRTIFKDFWVGDIVTPFTDLFFSH
jgi:hypothetical protein